MSSARLGDFSIPILRAILKSAFSPARQCLISDTLSTFCRHKFRPYIQSPFFRMSTVFSRSCRPLAFCFVYLPLAAIFSASILWCCDRPIFQHFQRESHQVGVFRVKETCRPPRLSPYFNSTKRHWSRWSLLLHPYRCNGEGL